jgi:hypothetical protein
MLVLGVEPFDSDRHDGGRCGWCRRRIPHRSLDENAAQRATNSTLGFLVFADYLPRILDRQLEELLGAVPIVTVEGAAGQQGKQPLRRASWPPS